MAAKKPTKSAQKASGARKQKATANVKAAQLKAAVDTVEQDHELLVQKLKALKDTIYCLLEPAKTTSSQMVDELVEFNKYFAIKFEVHLEEEETTLFPLLEKYTSTGAEVVARLRQQHNDIRRKRQEFEDCLETAAGLKEDNIAPSILQKLLHYGLDFWGQLDAHAHTEGSELHQCISGMLAS
jgi:hemerythrin-like domain-containing protein